MTDFKIMVLCASAIGLRSRVEPDTEMLMVSYQIAKWVEYNPLENDIQAVELIKKCHITVEPYQTIHDAWWWRANINQSKGVSQDWNRAVCECVARIMDRPAVLISKDAVKETL